VLTPLVFSRSTGHFRSSLSARALDRRGEPLPWYTYPAIDFLADQDYSGASVLEFGAGQSTLWWARRAREVVATESDPDWYARLARAVPPNATLLRLPLSLEGLQSHLGERTFDVVVVDGQERLLAAREAARRVSLRGAVVVDDSEGFWGPEGTYPIMDLFREAGFMRVDFYGHAPGVILPRCTSVFFRPGCPLLAGRSHPRRTLS
jgi:hypothetical protein